MITVSIRVSARNTEIKSVLEIFQKLEISNTKYPTEISGWKIIQNKNIMIKLKIGPFFANNKIIVMKIIRLNTDINLEAAEFFRAKKIIGPADRSISEAPSRRGFLIEDRSHILVYGFELG